MRYDAGSGEMVLDVDWVSHNCRDLVQSTRMIWSSDSKYNTLNVVLTLG